MSKAKDDFLLDRVVVFLFVIMRDCGVVAFVVLVDGFGDLRKFGRFKFETSPVKRCWRKLLRNFGPASVF